MKKSLFSTKTLVATGLGAALFLVLFYFVKIPSPVPNTNIQIAYSVSSFFGLLFGPIASAVIAFAGHAINDALAYGSCWWSWIIASGISGLLAGIPFFTEKVAEGKKPGASFYIWTVVSHAVAWLVVSPLLDVVMYGEDFKLVFLQGVAAFIINTITTLVVSGILANVYASTRAGKGTLDAE